MGAVLAVLEQRGGSLKPVSSEVLAASHAMAKAREVRLDAEALSETCPRHV